MLQINKHFYLQEHYMAMWDNLQCHNTRLPLGHTTTLTFQTIILKCINTKFHNLQHQKAFTSSWDQSREACVESLLVLEDQLSANCVSQARGFTLGELGASGKQQSKLIERSTH